MNSYRSIIQVATVVRVPVVVVLLRSKFVQSRWVRVVNDNCEHFLYVYSTNST